MFSGPVAPADQCPWRPRVVAGGSLVTEIDNAVVRERCQYIGPMLGWVTLQITKAPAAVEGMLFEERLAIAA